MLRDHGYCVLDNFLPESHLQGFRFGNPFGVGVKGIRAYLSSANCSCVGGLPYRIRNVKVVGPQNTGPCEEAATLYLTTPF